MGCLKPCLSVSGDSVEVLEFELYDEASAIVVLLPPGNPGFDDVLGEPFLEDDDDDQIGERERPSTVIEVKGKIEFDRDEEQNQDGTGNAPESRVEVRIAESELKVKGLIDPVTGTIGIHVNDRLLRVKSNAGVVRADFTIGDRVGLRVYEVRHGETGSGIVKVMLEKERPVAT